MPASFAIFASGCALSALLIGVTIHYWRRAFGEDNADAQRELTVWALKGLATPILFLILWNALLLLGVLRQVVPLMPGTIINTRQYVTTGQFYLTGVGVVLLVVTSFWATFALAQLVLRLPREEFLEDLKIWVAVYAVFFLPPAGLLLWWAGPAAAGFSAVILMVPVIHVLGKPKPKPFLSYAKATGRMKLGKYGDAEAAVIDELEKCETDYQGWLMLATLYAESYRELEQAEATVRELIEQPELTPYQISHALTLLADWQVKIGNNPQAARTTLKELIARCGGTPFARTAEHRLAQLPLDEAELIAQRAPRRVRLPSLTDAVAESQPAERGSDRRDAARQEIERLHNRLGLQPNDPLLLERMAVLQAEEMGEAAAAIKTIESLLARPDRPADKVPTWLSHLATWHLKFRHDEAAARKLLEQILRDYPNTPQAFGASGQLWNLEQRRLEAAAPPVAASATPRIVVRLPGSASAG